MAARSQAHKEWKAIDMKVTDAANESKDNVKYLTTLEKSLEPMYVGEPGKSWMRVAALLNNIKMMHTVARYYNTPQRMTTLFQKVSNQIINNCKEYLAAPGTLWNQPKVPLLERLRLCVNLKEKYQQEYKDTRTSGRNPRVVSSISTSRRSSPNSSSSPSA